MIPCFQKPDDFLVPFFKRTVCVIHFVTILPALGTLPGTFRDFLMAILTLFHHTLILFLHGPDTYLLPDTDKMISPSGEPSGTPLEQSCPELSLPDSRTTLLHLKNTAQSTERSLVFFV